MTEPTPRNLWAKLSPVGFVEGALTPWRGFRHMCDHPRLWRFAGMPIALNMIITVAVLALLIWAVPELIHYAHASIVDVWYRIPLLFVLDTLIVAAAITATAVTWLLVSGILCGYFYERLAREVEIGLGTPAETLKDLALRYHVVDAVIDVAKLIGINMGFLVLHIVPVIGSIVATIGITCFDCYIFGNDYLDFPLALRGMRLDEKRAFARRYLSHTLGLGMSVMMFSFIPILGAVMLSTAAAGAVLLYHRVAAPLTSGEAVPGQSVV